MYHLNMKADAMCTQPDCIKPAVARGLCAMHFKRLRRNGDPTIVKRSVPKAHIARRHAKEAWIKENASHQDPAACLLWTFRIPACGRPKMHDRDAARAMCEAAHGSPPPWFIVLHSCGNGQHGCLNPLHLRWGTDTENAADRAKHARHGKNPIMIRT